MFALSEFKDLFYDRRFPNLRALFQMDKTHYPNTRYMASLVARHTDNDSLKRLVKNHSFGIRDLVHFVKQGTEV